MEFTDFLKPRRTHHVQLFVCYYICFDFEEFSFLLPCPLPFVTLLKAVTASSPSLEESTVKWHLLKIFLTLWFHTSDIYSQDKPLVMSLWKLEHLVLATPRAIHSFVEFAKLTEAWPFFSEIVLTVFNSVDIPLLFCLFSFFQFDLQKTFGNYKMMLSILIRGGWGGGVVFQFGLVCFGLTHT